MVQEQPPRLRPAARAVVLDAAHRVLLVHFDFGMADELPNGLWACPGGGIEPGESLSDGLRRELREELGLDVADVGPPIWRKEHVFPMLNGWDGQRDTFYLVEVDAFEPCPAMSPAELLAEHVDRQRWWSLPEIRAAQDTDVFSPRRLAHLIANLLDHGRPAVPIALDPL